MKMNRQEVKKKKAILIANFGGPRNQKEIIPFLKELLTDQEVVRTPLPSFLHKLLFRRIAQKRAQSVSKDYGSIGGKSPIFEETEKVAQALTKRMSLPIFTFHRYLPATHSAFVRQLKNSDFDEFWVFPMFPQFSYSTTGSIAKWFKDHLPQSICHKLFWLKSYPQEKPYIDLYTQRIEHFIQYKKLNKQSLILLFSAHGLPAKFVEQGDTYQKECEQSFDAITASFPECQSILCYQSKFGPGQWLKPYTIDMCHKMDQWAAPGRKNVLFIPLAFTSDHIETLHEVETEYMPVVRNKGRNTYRLPAFNHGEDWIMAIEKLLQSPRISNNQMLLRKC